MADNILENSVGYEHLNQVLKSKIDFLSNTVTKRLENIPVNVKDLGLPGDGTDQTAKLTEILNSLIDGQTLIFAPGVYRVEKSGYFYSFLNRKVKLIGLPGAIIEVSDRALEFRNCEMVHIEGLIVRRTSQAQWGKSVMGINIVSCSNVIIKNNDISKFTDAVSITGSTDPLNPSRNILVENNKLHDLGEEPVAIRQNIIFARVIGNECYRHFGDAILIKATKNVIVANNFIHSPIKREDADINTYTGGSTSAVLPFRGGGITCNTESGEQAAESMLVDSNYVIDTSYGISLIGVIGSWISNNTVKNVTVSSAISVSVLPSIYNPSLRGNKYFSIMNNIVDGLVLPEGKSTAAIEARTNLTGDEALSLMDIGMISGNVVNPRGMHYGIMADGHMTVTGNIISEYNIAMHLQNNVIATGNTILQPFATAAVDRAITLYNDCIVSGNHIASAHVPCIKIRGTRNIVKDNILKHTGNWGVIVIDNDKVISNVIKDNIIDASLAKHIRLQGTLVESTVYKLNDIQVLYKDNDNFVNVLKDITLTNSSGKMYKITVDSTGNLVSTKL